MYSLVIGKLSMEGNFNVKLLKCLGKETQIRVIQNERYYYYLSVFLVHNFAYKHTVFIVHNWLYMCL